MPTIYIADLPEFMPAVDNARARGLRVSGPERGYWRITDPVAIRLERKALGLGPALWNTVLAGGIVGRLSSFDANALELVGEAAA